MITRVLIIYLLALVVESMGAVDDAYLYADGFPTPGPSPHARTEIKLIQNADGHLVRSEESYEEAEVGRQEYFTNSYLKMVRKYYPDQDASQIKLAPRPSDAGLDVHENLAYACWSNRVMVLDLYVPSGCEDPHPLVIFVHGGGWEHGSHRGYRSAAMGFAKRGFATATVEYRLAGEAMFPAAIYDVKAAIRWLRAHAETYQLDPKRFGITGGSAGGNIAVLTAVTYGDERFEGTANNLEQSSEIQCVVSMYGPMGWTSWAWTDAKLGSPLRNETLPDFHIANGAHLPPILFLNEWDHREYRNWGPDTMDLLKKLGKEDLAELVLINAPHGFINFLPHQEIAFDHLERFFGKHLGVNYEENAGR